MIQPGQSPSDPAAARVDRGEFSAQEPQRSPRVVVCEEGVAARELAEEIGAALERAARAGRRCLIGFATGRSPQAVYAELAARARSGSLDTRALVAVNLDEYEGLAASDARSFRAWMRARLFDDLGLSDERVHFPPTGLPPHAHDRACREFEERIQALGGIEIQLLGLGANGHIAFNEPGSTRASRTRRVDLAPSTRRAAAQEWGGFELVPQAATTQGVDTILRSRALRVLAFGASKADVVARFLGDPIGPALPATYLREHPDCALYVDPAAASALSSR